MSEKRVIIPLDEDGRIYAIQDEKGSVKGSIIGTGTREVCEVLLHIIGKPASASSSEKINSPIERRSNVRAAISI